CGNYFVTNKENQNDLEICSGCEFKKYYRCFVCGEYFSDCLEDKIVCTKCHSEYSKNDDSDIKFFLEKNSR
ncbi:MAG: hypothetical protein IKA37_00840, partial [Spirochaetales bacterium]|nr:hypothetical protein [Spirochaetales bacterium]